MLNKIRRALQGLEIKKETPHSFFIRKLIIGFQRSEIKIRELKVWM